MSAGPALLLIDLQKGFQSPSWGSRSDAPVESNVAALLALWRNQKLPILHVRHDSTSPSGKFRPATEGNEPLPEGRELIDETVYRKTVNSAFIGTNLERDLRSSGIEAIVIVGLTTNHCISTTARMSGNLGFQTYVVSDATAAFEKKGMDGLLRPAKEVHLAALSDLQGEFATIISTEQARSLVLV